MKKPDRIARAVDVAHRTYGYSLLSRHEVITLLRREAAYQRARVQKIVKREIATRTAEIRHIDDGECESWLNRPAEVNCIQREIQVCKDILEGLRG